MTSSNKPMSSNKSAVSSNESMSSNDAVSSMDNRSSMSDSNRMGDSMDHRGSMGNGSSRVGDLSDVAVIVVGVVVDSLDTAVRKVDRVGSLNNTGAIVALGLAEGSARVLVSHSIVVGVGGDLSKVGGSIANSVVGNRGMVNNRGMVDHRGGMDQGCGMGHSMAKTMSDNAMSKSMANNTVSKAVSGNNSVSKTVSGQELRGGRGSSQQSGDASKGLDGNQDSEYYFFYNCFCFLTFMVFCAGVG